ncbi:MAG: hypothetical protein CM15mP59_4730 [Flavobacteriaceae bacterium]|nr:MAG: hypothetical protein CM15mP59_4730 [Flavobacteriaceae bacterium]
MKKDSFDRSFVEQGVDISKVFAPEHGFRGKDDAGALIDDEVDAKTGIHIVSLHGKTRKPTPKHLRISMF